jgi:hypothetical protein
MPNIALITSPSCSGQSSYSRIVPLVTSKSECLLFAMYQYTPITAPSHALLLNSHLLHLDHHRLDEILALGVCGWSRVDQGGVAILLPAMDVAQHCDNLLEGLLWREGQCWNGVSVIKRERGCTAERRSPVSFSWPHLVSRWCMAAYLR